MKKLSLDTDGTVKPRKITKIVQKQTNLDKFASAQMATQPNIAQRMRRQLNDGNGKEISEKNRYTTNKELFVIW